MEVKVYSIFDSITGVYQPPFYAHNKGHALRMVTDQSQQPQGALFKYPSDFKVFEVGKFDDNTGLLTAYDKPEFVVNVDELVQKGKSDAEFGK